MRIDRRERACDLETQFDALIVGGGSTRSGELDGTPPTPRAWSGVAPVTYQKEVDVVL